LQGSHTRLITQGTNRDEWYDMRKKIRLPKIYTIKQKNYKKINLSNQTHFLSNVKGMNIEQKTLVGVYENQTRHKKL